MGSKTKGCCGWLIVALVASLVATAAVVAIMKKKAGGGSGRKLKPLPVPGPPGAIDSKYGDALGVALQFFQVQKGELPPPPPPPLAPLLLLAPAARTGSLLLTTSPPQCFFRNSADFAANALFFLGAQLGSSCVCVCVCSFSISAFGVVVGEVDTVVSGDLMVSASGW